MARIPLPDAPTKSALKTRSSSAGPRRPSQMRKAAVDTPEREDAFTPPPLDSGKFSPSPASPRQISRSPRTVSPALSFSSSRTSNLSGQASSSEIILAKGDSNPNSRPGSSLSGTRSPAPITLSLSTSDVHSPGKSFRPSFSFMLSCLVLR